VTSPIQNTVLHAGCGPLSKEHLPPGFRTLAWREIRYDIDAAVKPDIVGSITDMSPVATDSLDALYNSHVIEHLYPHEVPVALAEMRRVLKPEGFLVLTCPDLRSVSEFVASHDLMGPAYLSGLGPIAPIDILYGHRPSLERGNLYMAHRCGFTEASLQAALATAGFVSLLTARSAGFDLWAIATKRMVDADEMNWLGRTFLPPITPWLGPPAPPPASA